MTTLEHARRLRALGLAVIPVPRADGRTFDGKVPAVAWREYQQRLPTDQELVTWFADNRATNYAIVTGAVSDLVVVDCDSPEARRSCVRRLPYTPWQTRTATDTTCSIDILASRCGIAHASRRATAGWRSTCAAMADTPSRRARCTASGVWYVVAGDWTAGRAPVCRILARLARTAAARGRGYVTAGASATGDLVIRAREYTRPSRDLRLDKAPTRPRSLPRVGWCEGLLSRGDAEACWGVDRRPAWVDARMDRGKVAHAERYGSEPVGADDPRNRRVGGRVLARRRAAATPVRTIFRRLHRVQRNLTPRT